MAGKHIKRRSSAHAEDRLMEKQGGFNMLRLTMSPEEYLMIGDDVKIIFLGGSKNYIRIMVDAPKEVGVVRSRAVENRIADEELKAKLPKYYAEPEFAGKRRKPKNAAAADRESHEREKQEHSREQGK